MKIISALRLIWWFSLFAGAIASLGAFAAPLEKCPVARSCSQAKSICESRGTATGCFGIFQTCVQTGEEGYGRNRCTVQDRR